jgi:hypothetical protein
MRTRFRLAERENKPPWDLALAESKKIILKFKLQKGFTHSDMHFQIHIPQFLAFGFKATAWYFLRLTSTFFATPNVGIGARVLVCGFVSLISRAAPINFPCLYISSLCSSPYWP